MDDRRGPEIAVGPDGTADWIIEAVVAGGARIVPVAEAEGLVWGSPTDTEGLRRTLAEHPGIGWVQLPWAGIEEFIGVIDDQRRWTCGKGVYAEPVAEHALALALAGFRHLVPYARASGWGDRLGRNLLGARVLILGGGGITESLLRLLGPFGTTATVIRNRVAPMAGADRVVGPETLHAELPRADVVVLALALTPATTGIIGAPELALMAPGAWLINVARGRHVDTDALVMALEHGHIGGAALDVTDPEPLPDGHRLWDLPNCLITPHCGNTPEMARPLLSARITENIGRFAEGRELIGPVYPSLGY